jgi:hypothetical protein
MPAPKYELTPNTKTLVDKGIHAPPFAHSDNNVIHKNSLTRKQNRVMPSQQLQQEGASGQADSQALQAGPGAIHQLSTGKISSF